MAFAACRGCDKEGLKTGQCKREIDRLLQETTELLRAVEMLSKSKRLSTSITSWMPPLSLSFSDWTLIKLSIGSTQRGRDGKCTKIH